MYVADYVLMQYGSGPPPVPGHDERDFDFATQFELPDPPPSRAAAASCPLAASPAVNSSPEFDGLHNREALEKIVDGSNRRGQGPPFDQLPPARRLLSRQRYWGAPIPIVYCDWSTGSSGARRGPARRVAGRRGLRAPGPLAVGRGRGLGEHDAPDFLPRPGAPRDGHDGQRPASAGSAAPRLEVQELAARLRPVRQEARIRPRRRYSVAFLGDAILHVLASARPRASE